jgi:zinc protease
MKRILRFSILSIIILILLSFSPEASPAKERKLLKTTLDNGLSVIIEEDRRAPVVALQMWVRAGSGDESDAQAGIAHVFEHMLFKGTTTRAVGELAKEVDTAGGYINAYTSYDQTVYHLAVASRYFPLGLDILSDAIMNSSFDPGELKKELQVVLEEIRRSEDSPSRKLFSTLMDSAFTLHTYRRPVIGFAETVESFTREDILSFFTKFYIPNNMTLVVVGDIDASFALKEIEDIFTGFKKSGDPHSPRPVEPEQVETKVKVVEQPIAQSRLSLGFHITRLKDYDTYALDMLSIILGQGKSSRLYRKIKLDQELVHSVRASSITPKDPGIFVISAELKAENVKESTRRILDVVQRLSTEGPSPEEMKRALLSLESGFIFERETMEGKASQLGYYDTVSGSLDFEDKYIRGIREVTGDDIRRVITKYLYPENMTAVLLLNTEKNSLINAGDLRASIEASTLKRAAVIRKEKNDEAPVMVTLDNGIRLVMKEEHSNPLVAFYVTFPGGLRSEDEERNGIGYFTASMLSRGTKRWSRLELAELIESKAAGVGAFSGRNTTGIEGKFLSKDFDIGLDIIAEMLLRQSLPKDEIEKLKEDVIASIKRDTDNLPGHAFKLLRKVLYGPHPYSLPIKGSVETVKSFTRREIKKHIQRHLIPMRMVFTIVGDFDSEHARKRIEALFKDREYKKKDDLFVSAPMKVTTGIRATGETRDKAQSNIAIGFPGTTIKSKDRYALTILEAVLSGQGGRLFVELRDNQSLAYSISAFSNPGVDPGLFAVYIGTAPEKKERAVEEIMKILSDVRTGGITEEELARAKSAIIGSYEIGLQNVSSQASNMAINEVLGLGFDFHSKYLEEINAVSRLDVRNAAKKYLTLDSYVISVVGPKGPAD